MSNFSSCGSELYESIRSKIGLVASLFSYTPFNVFDEEDFDNAAALLNQARTEMDKLTPYLMEMPPASRHLFEEGGSHAQQ